MQNKGVCINYDNKGNPARIAQTPKLSQTIKLLIRIQLKLIQILEFHICKQMHQNPLQINELRTGITYDIPCSRWNLPDEFILCHDGERENDKSFSGQHILVLKTLVVFYQECVGITLNELTFK